MKTELKPRRSRELLVMLLELQPDDKAEALPLGDSDRLEIGRKVISIGNPMTLHNTLSVGVLSAVGRTIPGAPVELGESLLQTDAAVNPGNSGGPLLDSAKVFLLARPGQTLRLTIARDGGQEEVLLRLEEMH